VRGFIRSVEVCSNRGWKHPGGDSVFCGLDAGRRKAFRKLSELKIEGKAGARRVVSGSGQVAFAEFGLAPPPVAR
jgi:hypothetical protein